MFVFKHFQPGWSVFVAWGTWDGFFSFSAKRRGASRVMATDQFSSVGDGWGTKRSFDFARATLNLEVRGSNYAVQLDEVNVDTVRIVRRGALSGRALSSKASSVRVGADRRVS